MVITSAVCWGSRANTYKGVKNYRFVWFYWDFEWGGEHAYVRNNDVGPPTLPQSVHDCKKIFVCRCR